MHLPGVNPEMRCYSLVQIGLEYVDRHMNNEGEQELDDARFVTLHLFVE